MIDHALCDQVCIFAHPLPNTVDRQERRVKYLSLLLFEQLRPNDHLRNASFILQREEQNTVCGTGPLANRDDAGSPCQFAVGKGLQFFRSAEIHFREPVPQQRQWMPSWGDRPFRAD